MAYKALRLKNMRIGKTYGVDVVSGNGTIDMQGWNGVHTGGSSKTIILNGSGPQEIRYKIQPPGDYWYGEDFIDPIDTSMWTLYTSSPYRTQKYTGYIQLEDAQYSYTAGGYMVMNRHIKAGTDFHIVFDFPVVYEGHTNNSTSLFIELEDPDAPNDGPAMFRFVNAAGANQNSVQRYIDGVPDTQYNASFIGSITSNPYFKRVGDQMTIGYGTQLVTATTNSNRDVYFRIRYIGSIYNGNSFVQFHGISMPDGPAILRKL